METSRDVRPHLPNRPDLYAVSGEDAKGASGWCGAGWRAAARAASTGHRVEAPQLLRHDILSDGLAGRFGDAQEGHSSRSIGREWGFVLAEKRWEQLLKQQQQINPLLETNAKIVARRTDGAKPGPPGHAIDAARTSIWFEITPSPSNRGDKYQTKGPQAVPSMLPRKKNGPRGFERAFRSEPDGIGVDVASSGSTLIFPASWGSIARKDWTFHSFDIWSWMPTSWEEYFLDLDF